MKYNVVIERTNNNYAARRSSPAAYLSRLAWGKGPGALRRPPRLLARARRYRRGPQAIRPCAQHRRLRRRRAAAGEADQASRSREDGLLASAAQWRRCAGERLLRRLDASRHRGNLNKLGIPGEVKHDWKRRCTDESNVAKCRPTRSSRSALAPIERRCRMSRVSAWQVALT